MVSWTPVSSLTSRALSMNAPMNALSYLNAPIWLLGVFGSEKSYRKNPIIGSPKLNRWGLHRKRVQVAAALAASMTAYPGGCSRSAS